MEERTSGDRPAQPSPGEHAERALAVDVTSDAALDREPASAAAVESFESATVDLDEELGDLAELFPSERRAATPAASTSVHAAHAAGPGAASIPAARPAWPNTTVPTPEGAGPTRRRYSLTTSMVIVAPLLCLAAALVTYRVIERGRQTPVLAEAAPASDPVRTGPDTAPVGTSDAVQPEPSEPDRDTDVRASEPPPDPAAIRSDAARPDPRSATGDAGPRATADTPLVPARPAPEPGSVRAVPPAPAPVAAVPPAREPAVTRAASEGPARPAPARVEDAVSQTVFEADAARPPVGSQADAGRFTPADRPPASLDTAVARTPAGAAVANAPRPGAATAVRSRTAAVQSTLDRYRDAFSALDPAAAHAVWPSVDSSALGRAFDQLAHQTFEFDNCRIFLAGSKATASCTGTVRYVPKVGNRQITAVRQRWDFELREAGEDWSIERVITR